jgi:hypothetical protein
LTFEKIDNYYDWDDPSMVASLGRVEIVPRKPTPENPLPVGLTYSVVCEGGEYYAKLTKVNIYYANEVDPDGKPGLLIPIENASQSTVDAWTCLDIYAMATGISKYYSRASLVAHEDAHASHIPKLVTPDSNVQAALQDLYTAVGAFRYTQNSNCSMPESTANLPQLILTSQTVGEKAHELVRRINAQLYNHAQHDHLCTKAIYNGYNLPVGIAVRAEQTAVEVALTTLCQTKGCAPDSLQPGACPGEFSVCNLVRRNAYPFRIPDNDPEEDEDEE